MTVEPIYLVYDFEARLLGQRYLLTAKDGEPGYTTTPVAD